MKLHSNILTLDNITDALTAERNAGRIAPGLYFDTLRQVGSRSHARGFLLKLGATVKAPGRRWGNSGGYGATSRTTGDYAATHDEWGWLLAALYALDPAMVCGSVKYPNYADADDFGQKTGLSYQPADLIRALTTFSGPYGGDGGDRDPYPFVYARTPGQVGRVGYGRCDGDRSPWGGAISGTEWRAAVETPGKRRGQYLHYMPRTVESVRAFAKLDTVPA